MGLDYRRRVEYRYTMSLETWELLSYVVTVVGLPAAILAFLYEKRKERQAAEDEVHQLLSDNYQDFLKTALEYPDLQLFSPEETPELSPEQKERMRIIFGVLISIFERAYVLIYERRMSREQTRRWMAWEDYMREWCQREDFRRMLPELLLGEDRDFQKYIEGLAAGTH